MTHNDFPMRQPREHRHFICEITFSYGDNRHPTPALAVWIIVGRKFHGRWKWKFSPGRGGGVGWFHRAQFTRITVISMNITGWLVSLDFGAELTRAAGVMRSNWSNLVGARHVPAQWEWSSFDVCLLRYQVTTRSVDWITLSRETFQLFRRCRDYSLAQFVFIPCVSKNISNYIEEGNIRCFIGSLDELIILEINQQLGVGHFLNEKFKNENSFSLEDFEYSESNFCAFKRKVFILFFLLFCNRI